MNSRELRDRDFGFVKLFTSILKKAYSVRALTLAFGLVPSHLLFNAGNVGFILVANAQLITGRQPW
jgi:hypothetical protein